MKVKSVCAFKNLFDIYCAGCGGTRMLIAILNLDFYQAFRYNPFLFVLIILFIIYLICNIILRLVNKKMYVDKMNMLYILLFVSLLFMIIRNIAGFEFLLPTEV